MDVIIVKYKKDIIDNENIIQLQKDEIQTLEIKLLSPKNNYHNEQTYKIDYNKYKNLINKFNDNIENTNKIIINYKQLVENYNLNIEEYNRLAKTAYSRWFIIPMPGKSSKISK